MTDVKKPEETKVTQLSPNRLALAEHAHQTFVATPESGTPPDALLDPKCWAHYSVNPNMKVNDGDIIIVKPEDGAYFMELLVRNVFRGGIQVAKLRLVELDKADQSNDIGDFEIKWSGPTLKFRVIRKLDKREMISGLATKDHARDWIREHQKAMAA